MIRNFLGGLLVGLIMALAGIAPADAQVGPPPSNAIGRVAISVSNVSAHGLLPAATSVFNSLTLYNSGTKDAYCTDGVSATTATTSSKWLVPAGRPLQGLWVPSTSTYVACITGGSDTTTIIVYQGSGQVIVGTANDTNSGGTVTSITAGTGLSGGTITGSGTIALLPAAAGVIGGVNSKAVVANNFLTGIGTDGSVTQARPACATLSDAGSGCSGAASAVSANPTATIGASAVNGSASTFMRSDAAPALPATLPALSGVNLTNLNATNLGSGTVADGRLSANVPLLNAANAFTAQQVVNLNATAPPAAITGTAIQFNGANAVNSFIENNAFGATPGLLQRRADGTNASPTAVQSGEILANLGARPYDGSAYASASTGSLQALASENFSSTNHGTDLIGNCTAITTTTTAECFRAKSSGFSIPTGSTYQINGTQIAASNLSNGTTGSGAVVLAAAPALSGAVTDSGSLALGGCTIGTDGLCAAGTSSIGNVNVTSSTIPANGIYVGAANQLNFSSNTGSRGFVTSTGTWNIAGPMQSSTSTNWQLSNSTATATVPSVIHNRADTTTGLGGASGHAALIAGGVNQIDCISTGCTHALATTFGGAITYGGVAFNNASTGASGGNLVGSNAPTLSGLVTLNSNRLTLSGNRTASAWTTSGTGLIQSAATWTDSSSSGTVAAVYINAFLAPTIAASSATTFTNAYNTYFVDPVQGTNATLTNKWALGADSMKLNGMLQMSANQIAGAGNIAANNGNGPRMANSTASATVPTLIPNQNDTTTGIGGASGTVALIAAGANDALFDTNGEFFGGSATVAGVDLRQQHLGSNDCGFESTRISSTEWQIAGYNRNGSLWCNFDLGGLSHTFKISGTQAMLIDSNLNVIMGNAALATNATNGFLYIATSAGTPTGVPTAVTGRVPMEYDTTNHQFWIYDGGWKQPKTPAGAATVTWQ